MSAAKHTPGPWRADVDTNAHDDMRHGIAAECNALWVAACYRSGTLPLNEHSAEAESEVAANARLIAAAPELLEALRGLLAWAPNMGTFERMGFDIKGPDKAVAAARAAIAKAQGEQA